MFQTIRLLFGKSCKSSPMNIIDLIKNKDTKTKDINDYEIEEDKDQYYQSIEYIDKPIFICPSCKSETKNTQANVLCDCWAFNENQLVSEIEDVCKNYTFDVQSYESLECGDFAELCTMKTRTMFGLVLFGLLDEPNDWSSSPYDVYTTSILLFSTEKKRDLYYTKYKEQLGKGNNNFDTLSKNFENLKKMLE